jgi:hypothetical protein
LRVYVCLYVCMCLSGGVCAWVCFCICDLATSDAQASGHGRPGCCNYRSRRFLIAIPI